MKLQTRKPIRLKEYDYGENGAYFITICTKGKQKLFGHIVGEGLRALPSIKLTSMGEIVKEAIDFMDKNYENLSVDKYVIMPNHIHLLISNLTGGRGDPPLRIYDVVGRFKSFTTHQYGKTLWQRSFYDHVIRNQNDYNEIWEYIETNPLRWQEDKFYIK